MWSKSAKIDAIMSVAKRDFDTKMMWIFTIWNLQVRVGLAKFKVPYKKIG